MKTLLQPFAALGIRYKTDAFLRARLKLTGLYVLIVAVILAGFSTFLYWQVGQQLEVLQESARSNATIVSEVEARAIAEGLNEGPITEIEEEVVGGALVYSVEIAGENGEIDVLIDPQSGEVRSGDEAEIWSDILINDFGENLLLANSSILLLVMVLSYFLAGWSLRPVQKKMRQHEQFSADVAHELRTPLSAMLASVDAVLRRDNQAEVYKESLIDVKGETKRLIALSEGLMQTLHADDIKKIESVHINDVVRETVQRLESFATESDVTCIVREADQLNTPGDRILFERMFTNVIHNAIKFSQAEGQVEVEITANTVRVIDQGIGMDSDTKARVFDRLFTADIARDERQAGGAGLGMAIVKEIADAMNVEVAIESTPGAGTCVQLTFLQ